MSTVRPGSYGRDEAGRFGPGNAIARGNPNARKAYELRKAVLDSIDPATAAEILLKMGELAIAGDTTAARVWLEYTVGKPAQTIELSGVDGESLGVDWSKLQPVILGALSHFPEAKVQVALALRGLADEGFSTSGSI